MELKNASRIVASLNLAQAGARLAFALAGLGTGMQQFVEVPISALNQAVMEVSFLTLGIIGAVSVMGYATKKGWALKSMALVSIATIAFDIWGMTIQPTAAIGFVVPITTLGHILASRSGARYPEKAAG